MKSSPRLILAARAQGRAKTRLTYLYPEVYRALFEEEKAKLQAIEAERSEQRAS